MNEILELPKESYQAKNESQRQSQGQCSKQERSSALLKHMLAPCSVARKGGVGVPGCCTQIIEYVARSNRESTEETLIVT